MPFADDGDLWKLQALAADYYLRGITQSQLAEKHAVSRATISRLLAQARSHGIVKIEIVRPPESARAHLERDLASALGLRAAFVSPSPTTLGEALSRALSSISVSPGDAVLVGSGRWVHTALQADLPKLAGVVVAPAIGGREEPDVWYQTNEITRTLAEKVGGYPCFMFAPAVASPELYESISSDPSVRWACELWDAARIAIVGIGAPPLARTNLPRFVAGDVMSLRPAVGDVASRFIDGEGREVSFAGSSYYLAISLDQLLGTTHTIGVTSGLDRVVPIRVAAQHRYISQLVTDAATAEAILTSGGNGGGDAQATTADEEMGHEHAGQRVQ